MAPKKKKKNAGKGSKSKQQRGSSSTAVQSPASQPLDVLAEAAASDAPYIPSTQPPASQEQPLLSSTAHPGATPACPPVASIGLHSLSYEERVTVRYSFFMAGGPAADAYLHEMSKVEDRSLVWLEQGLRIMSSTFPYLTLMVKTLNGLWDKREVGVVMNAIIGTLEDVGTILDGYSMMTKLMVKKLNQGRGGSCSHGREEGGSSSGGDRGGGSSATAT